MICGAALSYFFFSQPGLPSLNIPPITYITNCAIISIERKCPIKESKTLRKTDYLALILLNCAAFMVGLITVQPGLAGPAFGLFIAVLIVLRVIGEGIDAVEAEAN